MTRALVTALAAGLIVAPAVPVVTIAAPQDRGEVFRAVTDLVTVDVTVQRGRTAVAGLDATDFEVVDNGVRQTITEMSYGRMPIDLRLVFDTSGSIDDEELSSYVRAMRRITSTLGPEDRCDILTFSGRIAEAAPRQAAPMQITARRFRPDTTAFFDAASLALVGAPAYGRRQLAILMTDAADTSSFFDESSLMEIARRSHAAVYVVLPVAQWRPTDDERDALARRRLEALAATTGGRIIEPTHDLDIVPPFLKAIGEFRNSYTLSYAASGVARGGWHALDVRVPAMRSVTVRAKRGYAGEP
jgi:VWFA-related protein